MSKATSERLTKLARDPGTTLDNEDNGRDGRVGQRSAGVREEVVWASKVARSRGGERRPQERTSESSKDADRDAGRTGVICWIVGFGC